MMARSDAESDQIGGKSPVTGASVSETSTADQIDPTITSVTLSRLARARSELVLAKTHLDHEWEQGTDGIERLITELTEPDALVVDLFAGTATWGRVVAECGRRWIGSDVVSGGDTIAQ